MRKDKYVQMVEAKGSKWTEEEGTKWEGRHLTREEMLALSDADFAEYAAIVRTRAAKAHKREDEARAKYEESLRDLEKSERRYEAACEAYDEAEISARAWQGGTDFGLGS